MAPRKPYASHSSPRTKRRSFGPFAVWRLFFEVGFQRPRSWIERRQLRFRATFFFVLGVAVTVAVQAALAKHWFGPK